MSESSEVPKNPTTKPSNLNPDLAQPARKNFLRRVLERISKRPHKQESENETSLRDRLASRMDQWNKMLVSIQQELVSHSAPNNVFGELLKANDNFFARNIIGPPEKLTGFLRNRLQSKPGEGTKTSTQ